MELTLEDAIRRGWRNDGTLPPNWERLVDKKTKQYFFVDHNTQTTSWVDPRDYLNKPHTFEDCVGEELPYGWEQSIDDEVGIYFINHNCWTTQLDDPRLFSKAAQQRVEFHRFLRDAEDRIREQRKRARELEENLRLAQRDLAIIHSKLRLAGLHGDSGDDSRELRRAAQATETDIKEIEAELKKIKRDLDFDITGLQTLGEVGKRTDTPFTLEKTRETLREREKLRQGLAEAESEKLELEQALLASSGMDRQLQLNVALQQQLEELQRSNEEALQALRLQMAKRQRLGDDVAALNLHGFGQHLPHSFDEGSGAKLTKELLAERDEHLNILAALQERRKLESKSLSAEHARQLENLQHQKAQEDKRAEDQATRMAAMLETQSAQLEGRVQALQQDNETLRRRLELILSMRQKEHDAIEQMAREGQDLSHLEDYVSKAFMAEQLMQLQRISEQDKAELLAELEAFSDVFMPRSKLDVILNSHQSQLDELRRLLTSRQTRAPLSGDVTWHEDLQTYVEKAPSGTAPNRQPAVDYNVQRTSANQSAGQQSVFPSGGQASTPHSGYTGMQPSATLTGAPVSDPFASSQAAMTQAGGHPASASRLSSKPTPAVQATSLLTAGRRGMMPSAQSGAQSTESAARMGEPRKQFGSQAEFSDVSTDTNVAPQRQTDSMAWQAKPMSSTELELEVIAARKELAELRREIERLRQLKKELALAEDEGYRKERDNLAAEAARLRKLREDLSSASVHGGDMSFESWRSSPNLSTVSGQPFLPTYDQSEQGSTTSHSPAPSRAHMPKSEKYYLSSQAPLHADKMEASQSSEHPNFSTGLRKMYAPGTLPPPAQQHILLAPTPASMAQVPSPTFATTSLRSFHSASTQPPISSSESTTKPVTTGALPPAASKGSVAATHASAPSSQWQRLSKSEAPKPTPQTFQFVRMPRSASPHSPLASVDSDYLLDGEEWMLDPKTQDMLHVREEARRRVSLLRQAAQTKVVSLRQKARHDPGKMSFHDKMAYFTTAGSKIHRDIVDSDASSENLSTS